MNHPQKIEMSIDEMTTENQAMNTDSAMEKQSHEVAVAMIQYIYNLLTLSKVPENSLVGNDILDHPSFQKLLNHITDLRVFSNCLSRGELNHACSSKGYVISNLKALQANLKHLTWQTQRIAEGDFSQRVDFLGVFSDSFNRMTVKLRDSTQSLNRLASFDLLTQIPNRLSLDNFLAGAFEDARLTNSTLVVMLFDIDFFKLVNDTYGHASGDKVLVAVSQILSRQFRTTDMLARYGGEEFVAVLPGMNAKQAMKIAQQAIDAVSAETINLGKITETEETISLTMSSGLSEYKPDDESYEMILRRSDYALYKAKHTGRNKVCRA